MYRPLINVKNIFIYAIGTEDDYKGSFAYFINWNDLIRNLRNTYNEKKDLNTIIKIHQLFSKWGNVLSDAILANAILDKLN